MSNFACFALYKLLLGLLLWHKSLANRRLIRSTLIAPLVSHRKRFQSEAEKERSTLIAQRSTFISHRSTKLPYLTTRLHLIMNRCHM